MNNIRYFSNIKRAVACIEKNVRKKFSYAEVSAAAGMSKDNLWRVFKMLFNETPASYARKRRLSLIAEKMVETKKTINVLCAENGWEMQSAFSRAFKQHYGISPEQYRKNRLKMTFLERGRMKDSEIRHILSGGISLKPAKITLKKIRLIAFTETAKLKNAVPAGIKLSFSIMTGKQGSRRGSGETLYTVISAGGCPLPAVNKETELKITAGYQRAAKESGGNTAVISGGVYYSYRHSGRPDLIPASFWRIFCNSARHKEIKHIIIASENRFNIGEGLGADILIPVKGGR